MTGHTTAKSSEPLGRTRVCQTSPVHRDPKFGIFEDDKGHQSKQLSLNLADPLPSGDGVASRTHDLNMGYTRCRDNVIRNSTAKRAGKPSAVCSNCIGTSRDEPLWIAANSVLRFEILRGIGGDRDEMSEKIKPELSISSYDVMTIRTNF